MQQTCRYRIKDPKRSLDFYTRIIGMHLVSKLDFPDAKFSLYFLAYKSVGEIPEEPKERVRRSNQIDTSLSAFLQHAPVHSTRFAELHACA